VRAAKRGERRRAPHDEEGGWEAPYIRGTFLEEDIHWPPRHGGHLNIDDEKSSRKQRKVVVGLSDEEEEETPLVRWQRT
jgi:hypothetical protein